jgi:hypothetical protein
MIKIMLKIVSINYLRIIYLLSSLGCGSSHLLGSSGLDDAHSNGLGFNECLIYDKTEKNKINGKK